MKKKVVCAALVLISIAAVGYAWHSLGSSGGSDLGGYPLVCSRCSHFFTLDEDELYTHPKSPTGEGFKCPQCGRFGARTAAKCDKCGQWVIMQKGPDGAAFCPKCPRP